MSDRPASRRAIDLSHEIVDGMVTHPGIPGPTISTFLTHEASAARYAPGTTFEIGRIDLVANTGTYLDTPAHRFAGRADLSDLDLATVVDLDAVLVDVRGRGRSSHRSRHLRRDPGRRTRGPRRHRLGSSLGHGCVPQRQPVPDRGGGPPPRRRRRGPHRHRLAQCRLARRPAAAGTHRDPRCGHPAGRAPHWPRSAPARWLPVLRRPPAHPRDGDLPGAGLRAHRRLIAGPLRRLSGPGSCSSRGHEPAP